LVLYTSNYSSIHTCGLCGGIFSYKMYKFTAILYNSALKCRVSVFRRSL
jgi:hypothetical protein